MNRYPTFVPLTKGPTKVRSQSLLEQSSKRNADCHVVGFWSDMVLITCRISSARQAVHRPDSLIGLGKRPDRTPSHQLVLPSGMKCNTRGSRKNPVSGSRKISVSGISCIVQPLFFSFWLIIARFVGNCLGERRSEPVAAVSVSALCSGARHLFSARAGLLNQAQYCKLLFFRDILYSRSYESGR